ncbi:hypothetical protein [Microbacterium gorillae]|uniref:hypothetical protein n=1 Tax=Microbacterium gorillae TaxID=1231063 RepID=UPI000694CAAC|nr:hypothetical protein [Microbacterium gorillae]
MGSAVGGVYAGGATKAVVSWMPGSATGTAGCPGTAGCSVAKICGSYAAADGAGATAATGDAACTGRPSAPAVV